MNTYGRSGFKGSSSLPWAAFISFVDSHEDTMTLISYLDEMFLNFLQSIDLSNTAVIFSSDHGLHYGPAFASNGKRERAEPILYMYLPPSMNADMSTLEVNKELWVTPYDVHETILDVSLGAERKADQIGSSLLHPLPHNRAKCHETPGIPDRFCSLLNGPKKNNKNKKCTMMREPPSVHSFYSDIIQMNRPSWPKCKMTEEVVNLETEECLCSTNIYPIRTSEYWIPCNSSRFEEIDAVREAKADPLRMKTCKLKGLSEYIMDINITVTPRQKTSEERQMIRGEIQKELNADVELEVIPNILFIEIDALSRSGAMRNLPKTMSLLQSHQIRTIEENEALHCPTGFCAGIFNKTSIIGQNSIPNQLAALSGCTSQNMTDTDFYPRKPVNDKGGRLKLWCPKSDIENPWFYTITKNLGYITFFGEEICFKASPFVVQNRYFWLDTDYTMDQLFCQLAQADRDQQEISKDEKTLFAVEYDTSQNPQPCVDGKSRQELAFEYIRGIWNTYTESPKFAYLSSGAAHDYSIDLAYQSLGIEAYDEYLSNFLEEMLGRSDAKDTVIILRSDHGLQVKKGYSIIGLQPIVSIHSSMRFLYSSSFK